MAVEQEFEGSGFRAARRNCDAAERDVLVAVRAQADRVALDKFGSAGTAGVRVGAKPGSPEHIEGEQRHGQVGSDAVHPTRRVW